MFSNTGLNRTVQKFVSVNSAHEAGIYIVIWLKL